MKARNGSKSILKRSLEWLGEPVSASPPHGGTPLPVAGNAQKAIPSLDLDEASERSNAAHHRIWAFVPAYVTLAIAVGAAMQALSKTISEPGYSWKIWFVLALGITFSSASRCGSKALQAACSWVIVLLVLIVPPLSVRSNSFSLVPLDAIADSNTFVTVLMGWVVLASVFAVGARHGTRLVPFTAPLVPALSLFGLLNIISVNSVVGACFLIFVGAALYLAAYERWLEREGNSVSGPSEGAAAGFGRGRLVARLAPRRKQWNWRANWRGAARGYLVASSAWFALFVGGAVLLYIPFQWVIPATLPATLTAASLYVQRDAGDWRQSPPVLELRGGHYNLSTREIMRVTVDSGTPSGLWRGHVYERYMDSRWRESPVDLDVRVVQTNAEQSTSLLNGHAPTNPATFQPQYRPRFQDGAPPPDVYAQRPNPNAGACRGAGCHVTVETVEPLQMATPTIHSSGQPFAIQGGLGEILIRPNATALIQDATRRGQTYTVRSRVNEPSARTLDKAPGLTSTQREQWLQDPRTVATLAVERDFARRAQLMRVAQGIERRAREAGVPIDTPGRKARAITNYLSMRCRYSLQSPVVPEGQDAVLFFLQSSRVGACDMFASSATLLLRAMNVPARLASGYIQPEEVGAGGVYTVRERDAHAWLEYYVPSLGWISCDPTQGVRSLDEEGDSLATLMPGSDRRRALFLSFPAIALLTFGLLTLRTKRLPRLRIPRKTVTPEDAERARIRRYYQRALHLLRRRIPCPASATPEEYENLVMRSRLTHEAKLEFTALTYLFTQSQFSAVGTTSDAVLMRACLARLRRAMRRSPKFHSK